MKRLYSSFLLICTFFLPYVSTAQEHPLSKGDIIDAAFGTAPELVFTFHVDNKDVINQDLTKIVSIDFVAASPEGGFDVRAYANRAEFADFLDRNIPYELVKSPQTKAMNMATTVAQMASWDRYPTYTVYEQMMSDFQTNYPSICNLDTILSATPDGRRILAVKISDNVSQHENEPRFLYSSSMHGDETTGYALMLRLINYLLTNYGVISKVTNLVNNVEIWICPLANPDGTYNSGNNTIGSSPISTRSNANGVDLNRNYPDPRNGQHPDGEAWQPETQAFMAFASLHHFNMSGNFHGGAEVMNYPWDTWTTAGNPNADDAWWTRVCRAYVDTARIYAPTYMTDVVSDGVTEGGDWYVIDGGRQDYMNFFQFCREVTMEIDGVKTTETQNLPGEWDKNYRSFLNHIQESLYGIRGLVTDSCSGQPLQAKVWVSGYDQTNDSSQVYSWLPVGDYHKYIIAGTYSVSFSAPGYNTKTISNVTVSNGNTTTLNVQLAPALPTANFAADVISTCTGIVNFSDLSTGGPYSWNWNFGDGFGSTDQNPVHVYTSNGTFTVSLTVSNCKGSNMMTRTAYISVNLAAPPSVTPASHCGPGQVVLGASGSGTLNWYDALTGGNLLGSGSSFTTPTISNTTTYYVQSDVPATPVNGGKADNSGAGGYYTSTGVHGLYFNCTQACTLVSVVVYSGNSGNKTIEIPVLGLSGSFPVTSGTDTVTLNWPIPAGTNYLIRGSASNNLYRNGSSGGPNLGYPFDIGGMISITQSTAGSPNEDAYYYFFYNWVVTGPSCSSSRVAVTATVEPMAIADFTHTTAGFDATFTNTSTDATSYYWNFGDGTTGTAPNPVHTYSADGNYTVMLIATNSCGSDTVYHSVQITTVGGISSEDGLHSIRVYPNPVQHTLYLSLPASGRRECRAEVINLVGESVLLEQLVFSPGRETISVDIRSLSQGVYFLKLTMDDQAVTRKIIVE